MFVLATLLVFGSVSDYLGRRRVILAGAVMTAGGLRVVPGGARGGAGAYPPGLVAAAHRVYLSLGPSLAAQVLRSSDILWGGLAIFLVAGTGAAASVVCSGVNGRTAMLAGCLGLLLGAVVTLSSIETTSAVAFLAGTAVAGAGFGRAQLGTFRTVSALAAPGQQAGLIAAYFIATYVAFSVPVVAGVAVTHFGLHRPALVYGAAIAVLAAMAAASLIFPNRSPRRRPT